ncbi:MAG: kynureninase [Salibacteraceae bacterium]
MPFVFDLEFAKQADANDPLAAYRKQFLFPQHTGRDVVYLPGNSMGIQPVGAKAALQQELDDWAAHGVEGHFRAKNPWVSYHEWFAGPLSRIVGARENEVVAMNGLTVNVHLLLVSFYRPTKERFKILCEAKAFPSDQYALETQLRWHGYDPEEVLVEVAPRPDEHLIRTEDILQAIETHGPELATVMIGGVNYYSGQLFDMETITKAGHKAGALVGFDLAHGVGNVPLALHDWDVDFAAWCSYKYLNSGPGSVSGIYVHERHASNPEVPRLAGWWGHHKEDRFLMEKGFRPIPTAESWQMSNAPVFSMAVHKASLELFDEIGMPALRTKSEQLTGYLEFVIGEVSKKSSSIDLEVITPKEKKWRGCQLSILAHGSGKPLFDQLTQEGVVADWREPNVIRIAPVPLYNSFEDAYRFGKILEKAIA